MESEKMISHTIQIAGETYPVKLTEEEMSYAIEIENEINEKISEYKIKYLVKTTRDILAMILLTYAFESKKNKSEGIDTVNSTLESLLSRISDQIKE
jgi:cell division protein ZapA (FtsZ GTPase activity inhibitor)